MPDVDPAAFTLETMRERVAAAGDPMRGMWRRAVSLPPRFQRLGLTGPTYRRLKTPRYRLGVPARGTALPVRLSIVLAAACALFAFSAPALGSPAVRYGVQDDAWLRFGPGTLTTASTVCTRSASTSSV